MANVDLGTAHGKVVIDYDGAGLKKAKTDLDETKARGGTTGAAVDRAGRTMGRAGLVVAAGLGLAAKSAADFEQKISGIKAVTGASGAQMDQLRQKALQLGKDTQFSASEAASAMEELAKAGVPLPDILNGAADATVALAAAGGIDLPQAATIASNAMNQFSLKARDMPKIADLIAGAANSSAIDVGDFGQAMAQAGAVAHSSGLSFKDTATAIAVLGNAGIKGSDAGTSLKTMLIQLANPTKKSADLMKQLGFSAFDSTGHLKSLRDISGNLQDSMKNMTPQARQAALAIIFGSDAARAGAIFFQNGAKGVDKMAVAMGKTKAADVAKTRMDNLKGSVEQLKGSVETAAIGLGSMGQGPLRSLVDSLTKAVNAFSNLGSGTQQAILLMVASLGGLALFGAGIIKTVKYVQDLKAALEAIKAAQAIGAVSSGISAAVSGIGSSLAALAANPIALIIIAIIALGIALFVAYKKSETFRNLVNAVFGAMRDFIVAVFNGIKTFVLASMSSIGTAISTSVHFIQAVWNAVWAFFAPIVRVTMSIITGVITVAMAIIKGIISVGMGIIRAAWAIWSFFAPIVMATFRLITDIIRLALAIVKLIIMAVIVILYQLWKLFWAGFKAVVSTTFSIIKAIVHAGMSVISTIFRAVLTAIRAVVNFFLGGIHMLFNSWIGQKVVGLVRGAVNAIKSAFNAIGAAVGVVGRFFASIYNVISSKIGAAVRVVAGIGGKVISALSGAGRWLVNAGKSIVLGLINGIDSMIRSLINKVKSLTKIITSWKGPPSKDKVLLTPAGRMIMQSLMDGFDKEIPALEKMLSEIGPGHIVASVARSQAIETTVAGVLSSAPSALPVTATAASPTRSAPAIDHTQLARTLVGAMMDAGIGEINIDGEVLTRRTNRIAGRITQQRRRTH